MWTREAFRRCRFRDQLANPNESKRTKGRAYIYRERGGGGTLPPLTLPRSKGGGGEKRWESGQIVPFDLPRGRFPRLLLVRRYENLPAHDKREGGGEDRAHPVRLMAPLPEKERSWKGERDGWPRNTSLKGR